MTIKDAITRAHKTAVDKGFWRGVERNDKHLVVLLALVIAEVGEAIEELRVGNRVMAETELADIAIRLFDLAGGYEIDLEKRILDKMAKNDLRPQKHGKEF